MKFSRFFLNLIIPIALISIIALSAFSRTINSYFLEDDFGEVLYVSQIFAGDWQKIITNFTGNYMEIPTMKVYRPCLLLSIMSDYALWGTKAYGYFITNIVFLIAAAVALYMVLIELTRSWYRPRSILFAIFSAALFASSPLHCESISLMVGRVDIICAFFYLLSFWSFIRRGDRNDTLLTILGVLSFWIAMLTKEMAIGLPVLLSAASFLFPDIFMKKAKADGVFTSEQVKPSWYQRIILALTISYPIWLSCLVYFTIRYFALGTIFGGYVGSVGASQFGHILQKWTDLDALYRVIFPLSKAVFTEQNFFYFTLLLIYASIFVLFFAKLIISGIPRKWLVFLGVWSLTTLAPIYQLWGLGLNLEGARFLFFLTIPLSIFLPLLIFAPTHMENAMSNLKGNILNDINLTELKILIPATVLLCLLVLIDTTATAKNNIPWVHAGAQTKALLEEGQKLAQILPANQKAIILGIPKEVDGAHVVYNGSTFNFIMSPPFAKQSYVDKFITFDPVLFGNADLINTSRFKECLSKTDMAGCYLWQTDKKTFEPLHLIVPKTLLMSPLVLSLPNPKEIMRPFTSERGFWHIESDHIEILNCEKGSTIVISPINIDPFLYDLIEIEASITPPPDAKNITVSWWSSPTSPLPTQNKAPADSVDGEYQTYRVALSKHWRWFTNGQIQQLQIDFPPLQSMSIKNIRLLNSENTLPKLVVKDIQPDNRGVYPIDKNGFNLEVNANQIKDCASIKLEYSKPNYFFDSFDSDGEEAVLSSITSQETVKNLLFNPDTLSGPGYYQLRAIGLDKDGHYIGGWSDPLTIKF